VVYPARFFKEGGSSHVAFEEFLRDLEKGRSEFEKKSM
jgi:hypothetical protein